MLSFLKSRRDEKGVEIVVFSNESAQLVYSETREEKSLR